MVMSILVMVNGCHISGGHVNSHGHVNGDGHVNDYGLVMVNKGHVSRDGHVNGSVRQWWYCNGHVIGHFHSGNG